MRRLALLASLLAAVAITGTAAGSLDRTPRDVVILHEMLHIVRVIPVDGRPHVHKGIRLWEGDARGRWDGNTLS